MSENKEEISISNDEVKNQVVELNDKGIPDDVDDEFDLGKEIKLLGLDELATSYFKTAIIESDQDPEDIKSYLVPIQEAFSVKKEVDAQKTTKVVPTVTKLAILKGRKHRVINGREFAYVTMRLSCPECGNKTEFEIVKGKVEGIDNSEGMYWRCVTCKEPGMIQM